MSFHEMSEEKTEHYCLDCYEHLGSIKDWKSDLCDNCYDKRYTKTTTA